MTLGLYDAFKEPPQITAAEKDSHTVYTICILAQSIQEGPLTPTLFFIAVPDPQCSYSCTHTNFRCTLTWFDSAIMAGITNVDFFLSVS